MRSIQVVASASCTAVLGTAEDVKTGEIQIRQNLFTGMPDFVRKICSVFGMRLTAQCAQITEGFDDMPAAAEISHAGRAKRRAPHATRAHPACEITVSAMWTVC